MFRGDVTREAEATQHWLHSAREDMVHARTAMDRGDAYGLMRSMTKLGHSPLMARFHLRDLAGERALFTTVAAAMAGRTGAVAPEVARAGLAAAVSAAAAADDASALGEGGASVRSLMATVHRQVPAGFGPIGVRDTASDLRAIDAFHASPAYAGWVQSGGADRFVASMRDAGFDDALGHLSEALGQADRQLSQLRVPGWFLTPER
jgi:hypothetical protein